MNKAIVAVVVLALLLVGAAGAYLSVIKPACDPGAATVTNTAHLQSTTFGAVTEYRLPSSGVLSNGITVGSDGAVWFGEQGLPGIAKYNPTSGALTEYQWSCYSSSQSQSQVAATWGVAQWNGKVWATDGDKNRLVGLDPASGSLQYVGTGNATFPYLLAQAPDGSLWFTTLTNKPLLGRLGPDLSLTVFTVAGVGKQEPIQVIFVNGSLGYMVALNPLTGSSNGGLYSFDPAGAGGVIQATPVGGNFSLVFPDGLSMVGDQIWIAQHSPSNLVEYDLSTHLWTVFPTSLVNYSYTTLPYFVDATPGGVWFNEHYANKIAILNPGAGAMTEYSESDPPVTNGSAIQNDLTIASTPDGLWFTSTSGDYLGFVRAAYSPSFSLGVNGSDTLSLRSGGSEKIQLKLSGAWGSQLSVQVSDSENRGSVPKMISIQPDQSAFAPGRGPATLGVTLTADASLPTGRYTVDVTVTDGLVYQTVFLFVTVS